MITSTVRRGRPPKRAEPAEPLGPYRKRGRPRKTETADGQPRKVKAKSSRAGSQGSKRGRPGLAVTQIDLETKEAIATFGSVTEAYKHMGGTYATTIHDVLFGRATSAFGYGWQYTDPQTVGVDPGPGVVEQEEEEDDQADTELVEDVLNLEVIVDVDGLGSV